VRVTPQVTTASRFGTRMSTASVRRWFGDTPRVRVSALCTGAEGIPLAAITYDRATLVYPGATRPSVDALDLSISDGEFLVLVGPSGCGKSTSLRMLAGLEDVTDGTILIGDKDVTRLPPKDRDIAMVFQNYALYPHMTVADNMGFALKIAGMSKEERLVRVREAARLLDLEQYLDRKPKALSGGQRQRVAMGRAIVRQPQVFLMDEPLSNLDAKLRVQTRTEIAALQRRLGTTTVYVTHDQVEAMTMGDRVAVLKDGVLQQVDTPRNLYDRPANEFVAGFIGSPAMNLVTVPLSEGGAMLAGHPVPLPREALAALADEGSRTATLGFRPEAVEFVGSGDGFPVEVQVVEELGSDAFAYGRLQTEAAPEVGERPLVLRADARRPPAKGAVVHVGIRPGEVHVFSPATGERISRADS
jgi:multiple sugar transport system ATP-binding protein